MRKSIRLIAAFGLILGLVPEVSWSGHAWNNFHWERSGNPVALTLGDNLTDITWSNLLPLVSTDWNTPTLGHDQVISSQVVPGGARTSQCRPGKGKIEICNDSYGKNGWLGIAQVWVDGDHITKANALMNDSYFNDATLPYGGPDREAWQRYVLCQEVGHDFGLGHQDENFATSLGSCMDYSSDVYGNQYPNEHDFEVLQAQYAHADVAGSKAGGPPSGRGKNRVEPLDLHDPSQWGRLMSSTHGGRLQTFEHEIGQGKRLITFVIWAR